MVVLIGVIAAIGGFSVAAFVARDSCLDAGGRWDVARRQCELANGAVTGLGVPAALAGVVTGAALVFVLYRAVLFFAIRASRRSP